MKWTGDLGVTDINYQIELRLFVTSDGRRYRLTVYSDNSFGIDTIDPGSSFWYAADLNVGTIRHLIGYAIRRAICRGIDTCEIVEDKDSVEIDLGRWQPPGANRIGMDFKPRRCGVEGCRLLPDHEGLHAFGNNIP
jgi:hypothetical protein